MNKKKKIILLSIIAIIFALCCVVTAVISLKNGIKMTELQTQLSELKNNTAMWEVKNRAYTTAKSDLIKYFVSSAICFIATLIDFILINLSLKK